MLHTKFQGHRSSGSGEEDFLRFLPYMGMAAMLVMRPRPFEQLFFPKGPGGCIWNLVAIGPVVSEEKSFEIVDGRQTDGQTDDGAFPSYKLPRSLRLRWAKNWKTAKISAYTVHICFKFPKILINGYQYLAMANFIHLKSSKFVRCLTPYQQPVHTGMEPQL